MEIAGSDIVEKGKVKQSNKGMIKGILCNRLHILQHKNRAYVSPQHTAMFWEETFARKMAWERSKP